MAHFAKRFFNQRGIPTDYVAAYNFNGNLLDASSSGLTQTLYNSATITNDRLNCTGTQYASAADPSNKCSFGAGAFTIACNINVTSVSAQNYIVAKRDDLSATIGSPFEFLFRLNTGKINCILFDNAGGGNLNVTTDSVVISTNTTYHIAVTYSGGSNGTFIFYVNGVITSGTKTLNGSYTQMRNLGIVLRLGNNVDTTYPLSGWMDNLRIYKRELTSAEITELKNEI